MINILLKIGVPVFLLSGSVLHSQNMVPDNSGKQQTRSQNMISDADPPSQAVKLYLAERYWDGVEGGEIMLNTHFFAEKLSGYIALCSAIKPENTKGCIDTILDKFSIYEPAGQFALDHLTTLFKRSGQEVELQYLDENYRLTICENDEDLAFKKRMEGYAAMRPGMPAPDINLGQIRLKDISAEKIIVAFWAGWCPHCMEQMPKLNKAIANHPEIIVIAVSLDDDPELFTNVSSMLGNMMHFCDLKKWEGDAPEKFYVTATPTFFLLDKDHKIVGKFSDVRKLVEGLDE